MQLYTAANLSDSRICKVSIVLNDSGSISSFFAEGGISPVPINRRCCAMPNPNDKCPCGSGKAYKDCCGKQQHK
jgi:hypothetical protein